MSNKQANLIKWTSIGAALATIIAVACGGLIWSSDKVLAYGPLPAEVTTQATELSDHEKRITTLEQKDSFNQFVISNQLQWIMRKLGKADESPRQRGFDNGSNNSTNNVAERN